MLWSQCQEVPRPRLQLLSAGQMGKDPSQPGEDTPHCHPTPTPTRQRTESWPSIQIPNPAGTQPAGRPENRTTSPHLGEEKVSNCDPPPPKKKEERKKGIELSKHQPAGFIQKMSEIKSGMGVCPGTGWQPEPTFKQVMRTGRKVLRAEASARGRGRARLLPAGKPPLKGPTSPLPREGDAFKGGLRFFWPRSQLRPV